jgi:hypothetical protein
MATKKTKVEEPKEEVVLQEETTQEVEQVVDTPKVPVSEDGITDRAYMSIKYKK